MVGIASRCPFEGIVMVAYATFFWICAALDLSIPLRCGRDDKYWENDYPPCLSFRPEKSLDFGVEKFFLFSLSYLSVILGFNSPFRLSEWNGAHGEICVYLLWTLALDLSTTLEMTLARWMLIHLDCAAFDLPSIFLLRFVLSRFTLRRLADKSKIWNTATSDLPSIQLASSF